MYVRNTDQPIITKHGCKCLPQFWYDGVKYTNKCILDERGSGNEYWCPTDDNCGSYTIAGKLNLNSLYHNDSFSYDQCYYYPLRKKEKEDRYKDKTNNEQQSTNFLLLNILSYILFIIIYLLFCYFLSKKNKELSLLFLANIDLVATSIQYHGGPGNNMFVLMYNENEDNWFSKSSIIITNLIALLGVILTILLKDVSFERKMIISFITLTVTYFLPNSIIQQIQYKLHTYLYKLDLYNARSKIVSKSLNLYPDIKESNFPSYDRYINAINIQNLKIYGTVDPIFQSEILRIPLIDIKKNFDKLKKKYKIDMENIEKTNKSLMKWINKNFHREQVQASDLIHYLNYYYNKETKKDNKNQTLDHYFKRFIRNEKESNLIKKYNHNPFKNNVFFYVIIVLVGLIISVIFILIEHYMIKYIHVNDTLDFFIK